MNLLYYRFRRSAEKNLHRPALYWRQGRRWKRYTYRDLVYYIDSLGSRLSLMGVEKMDRVAIFSENRPEWFIADMALAKICAVSVPIHVMSGDEYLRYVIEDSACKVVIVSSNLLERLEKNLSPEQRKDIVFIVIYGIDEEANGHISFDELLDKKACDISEREKEPPEKAILSSVVYTSGTTGSPKGVMLTDKNFISNIDAIQERVPAYAKDMFLSILPLSHVLERTAGSYVPLLHGASIAYAQSIRDLSRDLRDIRPTVIVAVPKIFERAYEKIFSQIKYESLISRRVFYWALHQLSSENKLFCFAADLLVYRKIRKKFGGRLRIAVCGGASMQDRIIRFFSHMKIFIVEGYGLTETSPVIATNNMESNHVGTVGTALRDTIVKIADDKEILVKGPGVMQGYWRNERETREVFTSDQWLKTGDLGFVDAQGFISIIGRKKDIIVTSNGKNIYPEKIEMEFNLSPLILQCLLVGHKRRALGLLVVLDQDKMQQARHKRSQDVEALVWKEVEKINKHLLPIERVRNMTILKEPFSLENQQLTATLKVRRRIIEGCYSKLIEEMYEKE